MLIGDFKSKLYKLNPRLIVSDAQPVRMNGLYHTGIYEKQVRQNGLSFDTRGHGDPKAEKYFAALETGQLDRYICGICIEWVPEYDVFNAEYNKVAVPGWRTILMQLVQKKLTTLDKARKVFEVPSLGEADYDRMSFFKKMEFAKKIDRVNND